jgi:hypothetical protein
MDSEIVYDRDLMNPWLTVSILRWNIRACREKSSFMSFFAMELVPYRL